ncbi:granzyme B(G,H)-like [Alosa alosa]|uniref:granzyme B(G,H)-like n=1 Tax=Alosa alosa TaxID=278164 RepID=UPI002015548C|nr:granzyme B(G,H)-like [Alosa alosa]
MRQGLLSGTRPPPPTATNTDACPCHGPRYALVRRDTSSLGLTWHSPDACGQVKHCKMGWGSGGWGAQSGYVGIVNGTVAKEHSRPYMVSVQKNKGHICGGFLVSESFVMTAAHCITWGVNLTVMVGGHDITNQKSGTRIPVKYYHINPGHNVKPLLNDIALLQLAEGAKQSNSVKWISIPKKDKDIKGAEVCSVAGWGATKTNGPVNNLLLQADVVIVKRKECKQYWNDFFSEGMLCARGKAGFCQGDSGGPLVCKNKAVGVVSFNEKNNCNKPKKPNVYTKISAYLPWIKSILKSVKH